VIAASVPGVLYKAVVYFWAAGPQLVLCMWLGYATCRRRNGRLLEWLIGGFAAALLPILGVIVMIVLFRRAGRGAVRAAGAGAASCAASSTEAPEAGPPPAHGAGR
jgi:hypothetical protein